MIKRIFGQDFENIINSKEYPVLFNIPAELASLYAAGIKQISGCNLIWITGENENTDILKSDIDAWNNFFNDTETQVHLHCLPWEDPYIDNHIDTETAGEKNRLIADLSENKSVAVITTLASLSIKLEKKKDPSLLIKTLSINDSLTPDQLIPLLSQQGYLAKSIVKEVGDYSCRGNILDIFPAGLNNPYRIKFSDQKIASVKRFHPISQISNQAVASVKISTTEYFETTKSKNTDFLYLTELMADFIIIATTYNTLREEYKKLLDNFQQMWIHHGEETDWPPVADIFTFPVDELEVISLESREGKHLFPAIKPDFRTFLHFSAEEVAGLAASGVKTVFCCSFPQQEKTIKEKFNPKEVLKPDIPVSLYFPEQKEYFISYLGRSSDPLGSLQASSGDIFADIGPGDFVVHKTHGIGRFSGYKHIKMDGRDTEFLTITFRDDANLYVPVHQLDILSKYVGFEGTEPVVDKIGGSTWEVKKKEARKNVVAFAKELLDLYAKRKAIAGYSYAKVPEIEDAFIKHFAFVETKDQKAAIKDVLTDLEAPFPMDRLICGDVSFGKTEIALRAVVRVVSNRKQVAVLCPTTVLAHQHFNTFKKRFASFPYAIEYLSRNVPVNRRTEILNQLASGDIDIIIGTHALLNDAVDFKDPGLFIIDEEQRFGVFQKEKLKKNREHVDVLSLSATPIPRTLSFTIAGLQDVSVIQSPPVGRKAIKNYIGPFSEELMMSAIGKESQRQGQTFVIYNNIEGIYSFTDRLQELLPDISMTVIHARMAAEEIEEVLMQFVNGEIGVLISTTIIENGIDIPNVNTLIITSAHKFGLTQLYQLRGRIGRGSRQAFTYFFYGSDGEDSGLSAKAGQRLDAIREFSQLGSGFKVAEMDLKMRGAGSLLGNKQHGHIEALGFDYYLGLLKGTISQLRGEEEEIKDTEISLGFSYSISQEYIVETQERTAVYRRLLNALSSEGLVELKEELEDRYGEIEDNLLKGFFAQAIKILSRYFQFEEVEVSPDMLAITLRPIYKSKKEKFSDFMELTGARGADEKNVIIEYSDYKEFMDTLFIYLMDLES